MGTARSFAILAFAVFVGSLTGAMLGGGTVAEANTETAASALAEVPVGAVVSFDLATCPAGWHAFARGRGRTVVGLNPGGTLAARIGTKLQNKEIRKHDHKIDPGAQFTTSTGQHSHVWATYSDGQFSAAGGGGADFVAWSDGMDNAGAGSYPLAVDFRGSPQTTTFFNTSQGGNHAHSVDLEEESSTDTWNRFPYIQLLMCEKD